jgi:O-antigen/teichoic acid export membrane protein
VVTLRGGVAAIAQTLLANVFILGINFGTGVITARLLGPHGRGEQAAIILWPQVFALATTLGLPSALLYNLRRHPERASQLFSVALLIGTPMGGIATVAGVLFIPRWLTQYSPEVVHFAQWAMFTAPLVLLSLTFNFVLQAREEFALFNAVRYLNPLATLLALVSLALIHDLTPFNAALAYLAPTVPIFLWMLIRLWRLYRPTWRGLGWAAKRLTSYGVRSYGVDLVGQLSLYLDRAFVVGMLTPASMGLYTVALSLAQMLNVFPNAAVSVLFPKASGRSVEEAASLAGRAARGSLTMTALAAVGLGILSPWALSMVYGREFLDAIHVFRLLLFVMVLRSVTYVLAQTFMAVGRPGLVTIPQIAGLALSVPLLLVLVPRYGLEGVGLALLISATVRFVIVLASFPLILKLRVPRLFLTSADLAAVAAAVRKEWESR